MVCIFACRVGEVLEGSHGGVDIRHSRRAEQGLPQILQCLGDRFLGYYWNFTASIPFLTFSILFGAAYGRFGAGKIATEDINSGAR